MPKSTRKKKLKAQDFQKKKLKVGKKVAPADNQTDVTFKTQKISLRPQKIAMDHEEAATAAGKQQRFKDLLAQCRHYNTQSRKEALAQIQDLMAVADQEMISLNLGTIANDIIALILDETNSVRAALIAFVTSFFGRVDEISIMPFDAVIVAYTTSAMSHISDSIRVDGLCLLKLLILQFPKIISKNSHSILPHFLDLLSSHTRNQDSRGATFGINSELITFKGRERLLDSFYGFLCLVILPTKSNLRDQKVPGGTHGEIEWNKYQNMLLFNRQNEIENRNQKVPHLDSLFTETVVFKSNDRLTVSGVSATKTIKFRSHSLVTEANVQQLFETLYPRLIDFWIESNSIFKSPNLGWSPSLRICLLVIQVLQTVMQTEFSLQPNSLSKCRIAFSKHVSPFFPFGEACSLLDDKLYKTLMQMNLGYCRIILQMLGQENDDTQMMAGMKQSVSQYVVHTLQSSQSLTAYASNLDMEVLDKIVFELYTKFHDLNTLQAMIGFQNTTKSMQLAYNAFSILARLDNALGSEDYNKWACGLPFQLYQLKTWNFEFSKAICDFLTLIVKSGSAELGHTIMAKIVPFFYGSAKKSKPPQFGPFKDLPETVQTAAVALLYYLPKWNEEMIQAIVECFTLWTPATLVVISLLDVANTRQKTLELALSHSVYASLLMTLGVGYTKSSLKPIHTDSLGTAKSYIVTVESFCNTSERHTQMNKDQLLPTLWKRRQDIVRAISTLVDSKPFFTRLTDMLTTTLPVDGYLGVFSLLSCITEPSLTKIVMDFKLHSLLSVRLTEFEQYIVSRTTPTDEIRRECVILCDIFRSLWLDKIETDQNKLV
ncbi:rRNA processing protein [Batrachochytrium dendrobatidis]|nr:rRNA processing protein [Batrachochytrium dendrobatidis]